MSSDTRLRALAERQWHDYRCLQPGSAFADPELSLTLDEAYAVQAEVARMRCAAGDAVAGYKIGCVGPGVVEQFGMSGPIHARLFRNELHHSGESLFHGAYANLAIEGEMALRIGTAGEIVAAFPVIELHHFVFRAYPKTLAELVANNGINAGVVIPGYHTETPLRHWADARMLSVSINGNVVDTGTLWAMAGGPIEALDWLKSNLGQDVAVTPGDLILAGTPLGLYPVKPGDHVITAVDGTAYVDCFIV